MFGDKTIRAEKDAPKRPLIEKIYCIVHCIQLTAVIYDGNNYLSRKYLPFSVQPNHMDVQCSMQPTCKPPAEGQNSLKWRQRLNSDHPP